MMRTFRVWAEVTTTCYLDVEADSIQEANSIANRTDGGDFVDEGIGGFRILDDLTIPLYEESEFELNKALTTGQLPFGPGETYMVSFEGLEDEDDWTRLQVGQFTVTGSSHNGMHQCASAMVAVIDSMKEYYGEDDITVTAVEDQTTDPDSIILSLQMRVPNGADGFRTMIKQVYFDVSKKIA